MTKVPKKIPFMKFSGAGNDFIVVDNRKRVVDPGKMSAFVASVCTQHISVGADGLILIEKAPKAHFRWRFYNNDGGEADFCGNGARCVARFAYLKQIAPKKMRFEGDRKSTRLNSSHLVISYAVFCLKKKKKNEGSRRRHRLHL